MSPIMLYGYLVLQRPGQYNTILQGDRRFQRYVVNQYYKVEFELLTYLRRTKQNIRVLGYTALCGLPRGSGNTKDETVTVQAGLLFIIPSTYHDLYMRQNMYDIILI